MNKGQSVAEFVLQKFPCLVKPLFCAMEDYYLTCTLIPDCPQKALKYDQKNL